MGQASLDGRWSVHFHRPTRAYATASGPVDSQTLTAVLERRSSRPVRAGTPFLLDPNGRPDRLLNDYFVRGPGARLRGDSPRTYAYRICSALNVLSAWGVSWRSATVNDIEDLRVWRVFDEDNPRRIDDATWGKQEQALRGLYQWAARAGVASPMVAGLEGRSLGATNHNNAKVKWFDPDAYALWRDVGLLGLLPDGTDDPGFRGLNVSRDAAFSDVLYRTGLRVREAGSVLLDLEWPHDAPGRRFVKLPLAPACAKGGYGRDYWVPGAVLSSVRGYLIGERAAAVTAGQDAYLQMGNRLVIRRVTPTGVQVVTADGHESTRPVAQMAPDERLRLFWEREGRLEPAALWLNRDGMPRPHTGWNKTFDRANERVQRAGLRLSHLTPHMLRHSFALRWFIVAQLLWQSKAGFLTAEETRDLRDEMGSHWALVQTMLGHRNPMTTRDIYLEPFQGLEVEVLLQHAADESVSDLVAALMHDHPRVQSRELR